MKPRFVFRLSRRVKLGKRLKLPHHDKWNRRRMRIHYAIMHQCAQFIQYIRRYNEWLRMGVDPAIDYAQSVKDNDAWFLRHWGLIKTKICPEDLQNHKKYLWGRWNDPSNG